MYETREPKWTSPGTGQIHRSEKDLVKPVATDFKTFGSATSHQRRSVHTVHGLPLLLGNNSEGREHSCKSPEAEPCQAWLRNWKGEESGRVAGGNVANVTGVMVSFAAHDAQSSGVPFLHVKRKSD